MRFIVVGISDSLHPYLPPEAMECIRSCSVFSGGKRHRVLVDSLLPDNYEWIDVAVPLQHVFDEYRECQAETIVVFASGDPLFYGFANTLMREMAETDIKVLPYFNSLQMLAHKTLTSYHDMHIVSLTGRPWKEFYKALIEHRSKIGVLTDRHNTPSVVARRMLEYGYSWYEMTIGENLGNENKECISRLTLAEAAERDTDPLNCLMLTATGDMPARRWGIPDSEFDILEGRPRMITKMPIRLLALQALQLHSHDTLWDVGFCTGSVSIEARLQFPHLDIEAFEIRQEGKQLIETNTHRFGAPGIGVHIGDFLVADIESLPRPDAVFIGGHGGKLPEILQRIDGCLAPGGVVVMNSVTQASRDMFVETSRSLGYTMDMESHIALDENNPITILRSRK